MTESGNDEPSPNPDVTKLEAAALPMFESSIERFEWHLKNGIHTDEHQAWCDWFRTTNEFKLLFPSETQNREEVRS